jgi:predicted ATP-grasp superfamily ATP-dependent carboligase
MSMAILIYTVLIVGVIIDWQSYKMLCKREREYKRIERLTARLKRTTAIMRAHNITIIREINKAEIGQMEKRRRNVYLLTK